MEHLEYFWTEYRLRILSLGIILGALFCAALIYIFIPPVGFTTGAVFEVKDGESLSEISSTLKTEGYVRSAHVFTFIVRAFFNPTTVVAGDYSFEKRISAFSIAHRLARGDFHLEPLRVTIPEGFTKFEITALLKEQIPDFDDTQFIALAPEGFLFPDTYFFGPDISPQKVVEIMQKNFETQVGPYASEVAASGRTTNDIVKMASIVETEARQTETRKIIAGILWRRVDEKMPLQVDVSFKYINGKGTAELTGDDLELDSPYNSYKYAGLPPTPIANPGLDAILATISPIKTPYLYFLSDDNGVMHYAATFEEHKKNKLLYLR